MLPHEGRVTHSGDSDLTRHVLNARLRKAGRDEDGRGQYVLEKAGPGRLIDACVASVLAYAAAAQIAETSRADVRLGLSGPPTGGRSDRLSEGVRRSLQTVTYLG